MAIVLKIFREQKGNRYGILLGNYITCVILSFVMLPEKAGFWRAEGTTWLCGVIAGVLFVAGLVTMQGSIRRNGAILTSAFARLGIIVPLIISILFFGERVRVLQIIGIVIVLAAFWLISLDGGAQDRETAGSAETTAQVAEAESAQGQSSAPASHGRRVFLLLLLAVLLACGSADAMAKVFEQVGERADDGKYFLILFLTAAVLATALLFIERARTGKRVIWKEFAAGILVGIPNYFSSALLLSALKGLPAFMVYPSFSAGTVLLVTLVGTLVFRERPGVRAWIGLGLIAAALVLLNI